MVSSVDSKNREKGAPKGNGNAPINPDKGRRPNSKGGKDKQNGKLDPSLLPTKNGQKVKKRNLPKAEKPRFSSATKLERTTFATSREMDFFSQKELISQTGHNIDEWPLVFIKEMIDNALDACEEAGLEPVIRVKADAGGISVEDSGPGLPESTLVKALDFRVRVSNREAYVSPCRGAQGNALKTILPMPYVIDPEHGRLIIEAHAKRHVIVCGIDAISQQPHIRDECVGIPTNGTTVRMEWALKGEADCIEWPFNFLRPLAKSVLQASFAERFSAIIAGFATFNPHLTIVLNWFGKETKWAATDPAWHKWRPNDPTSAHHYEVRHLVRLIGAYLTHERDTGTERLISDFISEFDGLSGSAKRANVLNDSGLLRAKLSAFNVGGKLDEKLIEQLLDAMKKHTRPVKAKRLGLIGEDHFRERFLSIGAKPESFRYRKAVNDEGLPYVVECAFGYRGEAGGSRKIFSGANWSAAIKNPFRSFGNTGEGLETQLAHLRAGSEEPILFALHLAHPRVEYSDRGKSALIIGNDQEEEDQ